MKINDVIFNNAISDALHICADELGLTEFPNIQFIDDESCISGEQPSFGMFDGGSIIVISKGRHLIDIIRTLCHELVHWKQRLNGEELDGSDGSSIENEANAIAGIILRRFGKQHPDCFDYS